MLIHVLIIPNICSFSYRSELKSSFSTWESSNGECTLIRSNSPWESSCDNSSINGKGKHHPWCCTMKIHFHVRSIGYGWEDLKTFPLQNLRKNAAQLKGCGNQMKMQFTLLLKCVRLFKWRYIYVCQQSIHQLAINFWKYHNERFSSSLNIYQGDGWPDQRGIASQLQLVCGSDFSPSHNLIQEMCNKIAVWFCFVGKRDRLRDNGVWFIMFSC